MSISTLLKEYRASIKSPDTEEKLDLVLYRPLGFVIAKISHLLRLTPTMLSLAGVASGFAAAWFYLDINNVSSLVAASLLFVLSGVFDSSDGQLARISGQSTKLGLILDGICDSFVMVAIYIAASMPFIMTYGWPFALFTAGGLLLHSSQSSLLDFYHREYLFFGYGKVADDAYWNMTMSEAKDKISRSASLKERLFRKAHFTWIRQQQILMGRDNNVRFKMREILLGEDEDRKQHLQQVYRKYNLSMLTLWRLLGPNFHTIMMIMFIFLHRFDLYLLTMDYIALSLVVMVAGMIQKRRDEKMFRELGLTEFSALEKQKAAE